MTVVLHLVFSVCRRDRVRHVLRCRESFLGYHATLLEVFRRALDIHRGNRNWDGNDYLRGRKNVQDRETTGLRQ